MLSGKQHPQKQQRWIARKRTTTKSPGKAGVLQTKGNMRTQKPPPYTCLPEPHCSPTSHEKPHAKRCCSSRVVRALKKGTKPTKPMMSRASSAKGPGLESARCRLLELTSLTHNHALLCLFTPGFRHVETSRPLTVSGCQEARRKSRQALQTQPGSLCSVVFHSGYCASSESARPVHEHCQTTFLACPLVPCNRFCSV